MAPRWNEPPANLAVLRRNLLDIDAEPVSSYSALLDLSWLAARRLRQRPATLRRAAVPYRKVANPRKPPYLILVEKKTENSALTWPAGNAATMTHNPRGIRLWLQQGLSAFAVDATSSS